MIRFAAKKYQTLAQATNFKFSSKTVGNIEFHELDSFTKVVLNRPKALNSLNLEMIRALKAEMATMDKGKAVWFEGAGGKAFCAGGDVKDLFAKDATVEDRLTFFRQQFTTDYLISQLNAWQIAVWDGIVMGGGFGITSMASFKIATQNSMFAMPEARLGFFTDICSCYTLAKLRNNIGFYLGMTGSRLKGQDLYVAGLANYYIPRKSLEAVFNELKEALPSSQKPKQTISAVLTKYHQPSGRAAIADEEQINQIFGLKDFREIYKRLSSQTDKFSVDATKALNQQCPPSVGVIHRLIQTAKGKSYRECFLRDYKLVQNYIVDPNFAQGVRSVLIDKGSKAIWSHKSILDVSDSEVGRYFQFPSTFQNLKI